MPGVWAPAAAKVELVQGDRTSAMERTDDGWWHSLDELAPGEDYRFRIDGEEFVFERGASGIQHKQVHRPVQHALRGDFRCRSTLRPGASARCRRYYSVV